MTIVYTTKQPEAVDNSNVIPFPGKRVSRRNPNTKRTRSDGFGQLLHRAKDALLRLIRSRSQVPGQRSRGSTTPSAARYPDYPQPTLQDHDGGAARKRMSG